LELTGGTMFSLFIGGTMSSSFIGGTRSSLFIGGTMSSSFQTPKEFLSGVINVPVYEAPKELVVKNVLKS